MWRRDYFKLCLKLISALFEHWYICTFCWYVLKHIPVKITNMDFVF